MDLLLVIWISFYELLLASDLSYMENFLFNYKEYHKKYYKPKIGFTSNSYRSTETYPVENPIGFLKEWEQE